MSFYNLFRLFFSVFFLASAALEAAVTEAVAGVAATARFFVGDSGLAEGVAAVAVASFALVSVVALAGLA